MGVRARIAGAFLLAGAAILLFTVAVIRLQLETIERGAQVEARDLARSIAYGAMREVDHLQDYVEGLDRLYGRDIVVVDARQWGVADAHRRDLGRAYTRDLHDEVGATIRDGQVHFFTEKSPGHPGASLQVAAPMFESGREGARVIGAVILEYTPIRQDLVAASMSRVEFVGAVGLAFAALVAGFGLRLARSTETMTEELVTSRQELLVEIERQKAASQQIAYLAYRDKLTGLMNRAKFSKRLGIALENARKEGTKLAILFVDLDRFKTINDALGHTAGDELLQVVASRLEAFAPPTGCVARLGGDEFVVLVSPCGGAEELAALARRILSAVAGSLSLHGQDLHVTASIGISVYPGDGDDERVLMKNADIAMYQAKDNGKNGFAQYSPEMARHSVARLALESSLRRSLELHQFVVHYQPKIDSRSGRITGLEALLRWQHPDLGMVSPADFIPLAEETGLIVPIGAWVLRTVCEQLSTWRREGLSLVPIAVNLSARQFADDRLLGDVRSVVAETGVDPALLELEITESMLMNDVAKASAVLRAFKEMGIRLSVDDFGTGYSSLSNLKRFPIDTIKVDRSFVRELPGNDEDAAIVEAIIAMASALELKVVAEGVETSAQADFLRRHRCDEFQGFLFGRPMAAGAILPQLRAGAQPVRARAEAAFNA